MTNASRGRLVLDTRGESRGIGVRPEREPARERPPWADFDPVAGLDPETYALSLRVSCGPARCLSDSLYDRPWVCYPLRLPGVEGATREVLDT